MTEVSLEQVRQFRLRAHHLDTWYFKDDLPDVVGACGMQNSPPGAWENALRNRIPSYGQEEMRQLLEVEKTLLQAWSFRGAPVVFPASDSAAFLSALVPEQDEPWIYTRGIQLALDFLGMSFAELLAALLEVVPKLDVHVLKSKTTLDQSLADWMLPLLPDSKQNLWNKPSMYGSPDKQTVGGAVVSFLLRPCAFLGLVVFGKRAGSSPTFTSYKNWLGHPLEQSGNPEQQLARKYLHCYGPASVSGFADWLGACPAQAKRMWQTIAHELEPVSVAGKQRHILSSDKNPLLSPPQPERTTHLLGGHDPYLGLQDKQLILADKARQKQIWQTVANPGAVLFHGEIAGLWQGRKKGKGLELEIKLWEGAKPSQKDLRDTADAYASNQQLTLSKITVSP